MKERIHMLQAKFLLRSIDAPEDTLLSKFLPFLRTSASHSQLYKLSKTPVWKYCTDSHTVEELNTRTMKSLYKSYRENLHETRRNEATSILLSACRPNIGTDPVLWLPMTHAERSRVLRWRLGWLPGGVPKPCIFHPHELFIQSHAIHCLHMHRRLQMPFTEHDPLSFLLNMLPSKSKKKRPQTDLPFIVQPSVSAWSIRWTAICQILFELDYLHHGKIPPDFPPSLSTKLIDWMYNH